MPDRRRLVSEMTRTKTSEMTTAVMVFAKEPAPGRVKTRLSPAVSPEDACALYEAFLQDVLEMVERFGDEHRGVQPWLAWSGSLEASAVRGAVDQGFRVHPQGDGDLGDRMKRGVAAVREAGGDRVIILGTDSPTLSKEHLSTALLLLRDRQVVFGPSFDGGYYLLGLDLGGDERPEEVIFEGISWSTPAVMEESWARAQEAGLLCELLGFWYDVDTVEDLKTLRFHLVDYLAERDPQIARHTGQLLASRPSLLSPLEPSHPQEDP